MSLFDKIALHSRITRNRILGFLGMFAIVIKNKDIFLNIFTIYDIWNNIYI